MGRLFFFFSFFNRENNRQACDNSEVARTVHLYSTDTFTFSNFTV